MKRFFSVIFIFFAVFLLFLTFNIDKHSCVFAFEKTSPKMAIVIDDFGSFDESGVDLLKQSNVPLTCAVIPFVDNSNKHANEFKSLNHEIILHMPMESHVSLPKNWYGPVYISCNDNATIVNEKLNKCLKEFDDVKGFNIHIGSGVSQNQELMTIIYNFAKKHNLYFLDSRTIETKATENACKETNSIYLGRDVFLEADKNRSYNGVIYRLKEGIKIAKEKGYCIVIGHVGAEGGVNTAKAVLDMQDEFEKQGVEIVTLSKIYENLIKNNH